MPVTGCMLIGQERVAGTAGSFQATNPASGSRLAPPPGGATPQVLHRACAPAAESFDAYREAPLAARALFLETIAGNVLDLGDELIARGSAPWISCASSHRRRLSRPRAGSPSVRPLPRPDLRLRYVAGGPVAVFGASNFPLAFSVAGVDTASVGTLAVRRFLRPVCYQDAPSALLPESLQDANPLGLWRLKDGRPGHD